MSPVRLQKILSHAGIASRRAAENLIVTGRVEVNGRLVTTLGTKADPERDEIKVDGRRLTRPPARRYLLLYKPRGVVSTRTDPQGRTTVADLVRRAGLDGYFYPVGRLDYDSEGLMIVTNDGDFAERVLHPRYELARTYEVEVAGIPDARDLARLRTGVTIDGERTRPARVTLRRSLTRRTGPTAVLEITVHEGRNRQVRRMADAIAHPVERLRRVRIGPLGLEGMKPGDLRELTSAERRRLTETPAPARLRRSARSS
jgi:pseudouridine synthase